MDVLKAFQRRLVVFGVLVIIFFKKCITHSLISDEEIIFMTNFMIRLLASFVRYECLKDVLETFCMEMFDREMVVFYKEDKVQFLIAK